MTEISAINTLARNPLNVFDGDPDAFRVFVSRANSQKSPVSEEATETLRNDIKKGKLDRVAELIAQGADPAVLTEVLDGFDAGQWQDIFREYLLPLTDAGLTALHIAVMSGATNAELQMLIENGANASLVNRYGDTPLQMLREYRERYKDDAQRRATADRMIDFLSQKADDATEQLKADLKEEKFDRVGALISAGGDPELLNKKIEGTDGERALHLAIKNGESEEVLETLVRCGADLTLKNDDGKRPIELTNDDDLRDFLKEQATKQLRSDLKAENFDRIKALLQVGAKKSVFNETIDEAHEWKALHLAVYNAADIDVIKTLIENGADLTATDYADQTPYQMAAERVERQYGENSHMARIRDYLIEKATEQARKADADGNDSKVRRLVDTAGARDYVILSEYERHMDELARSMAENVNYEDGARKLKGFLYEDHRDHFKFLVQYKLHQQARDGHRPNLGKAISDVVDGLYDKIGPAAEDLDLDAGKVESIFDGYWKRRDGPEHALKLAKEVYTDFRKKPSTNNPDYDDNLNALVAELVSGAVADQDTLVVNLNDGTLAKLYKNLIKGQLNLQYWPLDLARAKEQVEEDIFGRLGSAADQTDANADKIFRTFKNYWNNGGKQKADSLAQKAFTEFENQDVIAPSSTALLAATTTEDDQTVEELYMKKLEEEYGDDDEDSVGKKYLNLLKAKAISGGGAEIFPYFEDIGGTHFDEETAVLTATQTDGLFNLSEIDVKLGELLANNEEIAVRSEELLKEAVKKIKDKDTLTDRIVTSMQSDGYRSMLLSEDSSISGSDRFATDMRALTLLDEDKSIEVQQNLVSEELARQIEDNLVNPEDLNIEMSATDIGHNFVRAFVLASYLGDAAVYFYKAYDDYVNGKTELDRVRVNGNLLTAEEKQAFRMSKIVGGVLGEAISDAMNAARANGEHLVEGTQRRLTNFDIDKALRDKNLDPPTRGTVKSFFTEIARTGALTTLGGMACFVAAVITMTKGEFDELTPDQRMGSAFYLLFTASGAEAFINQLGGASKRMWADGDFRATIGLGQTWQEARTQKVWIELGNYARSQLPAVETAGLGDSGRTRLNKTINIIAKKSGLEHLSKSDKLRLIGPGLRVLGNVAYGAGAILGIIMGIRGLQSEKEEDRILGGLALGGGLAWVGGAAAGIISSFGVVGAGIAATTLGAVGIIFAVVGLALALVFQKKENEKVVREVQETFDTYDKLGIMEEGWREKLNYLIHVEYWYHNENITEEWLEAFFPANMTPWEAQPDQFRKFTEVDRENGGTTSNWWHPYHVMQKTEDGEELTEPYEIFNDDYYLIRHGDYDRFVHEGSTVWGPGDGNPHPGVG